MTNDELQKELAKFDGNLNVHLEVYVQSDYSTYGHLIGVSQSEPSIIVLSNRKRTP